MTQIVVPFRGENGQAAPRRVRTSARRSSRWRCSATSSPRATVTGRTLVVSRRQSGRALAAELGAEPVDGCAGGGQGAAVAAALERLGEGTVLVVNADLPCVVPHDLRTLAGAAELGAIGYVEAEDGTTNALALPRDGALRAALRRRQRRPLPRPRRQHRRAGDRLRDPEPRATTSTRSTTCDRIGLRAGPRTQAAIGRALQP